MSDLLSLFLLVLVYVDILICKRFDKATFLNVFKYAGRSMLALFLWLTFLFFCFERSWAEFIPLCFWVSFLAVYILRRSKVAANNEERFFKDKQGNLNLFYFSDSLSVLIHWFFSVIIFSFFISKVSIFLGQFHSELGELVLTGVFSMAVMIILIRIAARKFSGEGFFYNIDMLRPRHSFLKTFFLPALTGSIFAFISSYVVVFRKIQPQTPLNDALSVEISFVVVLLFIVLAIFLAPFIEEVVFRGYFFKVIKNLKGKTAAFFTVSIVFGALHMPQYWGDWLAIFIVFILGFVLTGFRVWTGTAFASAVTHYFYNSCMVIIPVIMLAFSNQPYLKYTMFYDTYSFQEKEGLLRESIAEHPGFSKAYNDLALMYLGQDAYKEKALVLIDKALDLDPDNEGYLETKKKIEASLNF